jgi:hypothetical protein
VLDTATMSAILDSPIVPGTVIGAVLCPSGRDQEIRVTIKCRESGKCVTFGVGPSAPLADIVKTVVHMSHHLATNVRHSKFIAAQQRSFLKT